MYHILLVYANITVADWSAKSEAVTRAQREGSSSQSDASSLAAVPYSPVSSNSSLVVGSSGGSAVRRRSVNLFIVDVVKRIVEETAHKFTIDITAN